MHVENIRHDMLARKLLLDTTLLNHSLSQLEFLPTLSFASGKVGETTASRMDFLRNEVREMAAEVNTVTINTTTPATIGANASGSAASNADTASTASIGSVTSVGALPTATSASTSTLLVRESLADVVTMLTSERDIAWLRILAQLRFVTEALLIREDVLGLEFVHKVVRIVRCEIGDGLRHLESGGVRATRSNVFQHRHDLLTAFTPPSEHRLISTSEIYGAHPTTALHRLAQYFLYWCDRRVLASFEGLGREQATMNKLVYRMSKEATIVASAIGANSTTHTGTVTSAGPDDPSGSSLPSSSPSIASPPPSISSRARAEHAARTMRGALQTAQLFDAFYQMALEREEAQKAALAKEGTSARSGDAKINFSHAGPSLKDVGSSVLNSCTFAHLSSSSLHSSLTWSDACRASLANPFVSMFGDGVAYLRALEVADCNLVAKVNEIRRRESTLKRVAGTSNTNPNVPTALPNHAFLSILERTSNQSALLMAAASVPHHNPTSLQVNGDVLGFDFGSSSLFSASTSSSSAVGALNSSAVFGFTLFALGLRQHDQELFQTILRDQLQIDLFTIVVTEAKQRLMELQKEETKRQAILAAIQLQQQQQQQQQSSSTSHSSHLPSPSVDPRFTSIMQATKILLNEVQDASYEMNVIKEWLAASNSTTGANTIGSAVNEATVTSASSSSSSAATTAATQKHKMYYVLPKDGFNKLLTQLIRDILTFGNIPRQYRLHVVDTINSYTAHTLAMKSQILSTLHSELTEQVREYPAQSLAQVTDLQYAVILRLQEMKEEGEYLEKYMRNGNQENVLRSAIEKEYEMKVHKLSMSILSLSSQSDINNIAIRQRILTHYYELKKSTLEDMIKNGSAPFMIKKRALKILSSEAKFQEMKNEYYALNSTYLKLNTLYDMKDLLQQRMFSKEESEIYSLTHSHEELLASIRSLEDRSKLWQHELQETKNSLMLSHQYLEELQKSFLHYRKENMKLNNWKKVQLQKLSRLEMITRKFEDVSEYDFDKLEADLRQKAEEMITALKYEKNADIRQKLMEAAQQKVRRREDTTYTERSMFNNLSFPFNCFFASFLSSFLSLF